MKLSGTNPGQLHPESALKRGVGACDRSLPEGGPSAATWALLRTAAAAVQQLDSAAPLLLVAAAARLAAAARSFLFRRSRSLCPALYASISASYFSYAAS
jgi:hypothetical protein